MSNLDTEFDPDVDLSIADEAPRGMQFTEEAGDNLVNAIPADQFIDQEGIEGLLWLGYLTDTFDLYGHTFVVRTLTRGERMACTLVAKEWEDTLGMAAAYETATVAAALQFIDGEPFQPQLQSTDPQYRIKQNFLRVQNWYEPVVQALGRKIQLLHIRQIEAFNELESK